MEWLKNLSTAIDYIEDNLDNDISYDEAAQIACCSPFYFQRLFSYVSGISLSEYIRRRRMTQAAFELQRTNAKVIDIALKYGYTSPTSFNRAFQSVHNIPPTAARNLGSTLNAYPAIRFSVQITGGNAMAYHIAEKYPITTSSFINGEEGLNEHGLAVAMTFVMTSLEKIRAGFNSCFIVRYLLEKADSTDNAISMLMELPIASNCNILIADKSGKMFVIECTPFTKRIREAENVDGGKIVCTVNNFTSDEMKLHDAANGDDYHATKRYHTVMDSFHAHINGNLIEATEQLLKGAYGFICQYDDEPDFETVWSSVFDLESLIIYRAEGEPRKKKFLVDSRLHDIVQGK